MNLTPRLERLERFHAAQRDREEAPVLVIEFQPACDGYSLGVASPAFMVSPSRPGRFLRLPALVESIA